MANRGTYIANIWVPGELVAAEKLNRLEQGLSATDKDTLQTIANMVTIQQNMDQGIGALTSRLDSIEEITGTENLIETITNSVQYINDLSETLSAAVAQAENNISSNITIIEQQQLALANQLNTINVLLEWINATNNTLSIGTSPYKIVLGPEHLQFLYNNQEIGRFTQNVFYDSNTNISKKLTLGDFIITVTENNKALVWT